MGNRHGNTYNLPENHKHWLHVRITILIDFNICHLYGIRIGLVSWRSHHLIENNQLEGASFKHGLLLCFKSFIWNLYDKQHYQFQSLDMRTWSESNAILLTFKFADSSDKKSIDDLFRCAPCEVNIRFLVHISSCLRHLVYCSQNFLNYLVCNLCTLSVTWWWLLQKRVVRTKFDVNVFILTTSVDKLKNCESDL
jgi:hypothetical protein